jgi:hypothetical protein
VRVQKVVFVENKVGMDYVTKNPYGPVGRDLDRRARKVQAAAVLQAGFKTGALKSSISVTQSRELYGQSAKIGSSLSYALLHHEGSRPHLINGRNGGMLRFTSRGRVVYARQVMHPGTKPNKYLADNLWLALT